jgi:hypothetical protein
MSRNSDTSVRLVGLASLLAAASLLAGCPDRDLPVGSVDSGAAGGGGTSSGEDARGGRGGESSDGGDGPGGSAIDGSGGPGSLDAGTVPSCGGDTRSPVADGCTPAVIEQDLRSCSRCGDIGYIWDGAICKGIGGCACVKGCERVFKTKDACNTAHLGCGPACPNPTPRVVSGMPTGYVQCDGFTHRPERRDCPSKLPRLHVPHPAGPGVACLGDADCTARPYGHCEAYATFAGEGWACRYGCVKDEDCDASQICECGDPIGTCRSSTCKTTSDCAPGMFCASGSGEAGCEIRYACQTAADECTTSADCPQPGSQNYCAITAAGRACRSRPQDSACQ